MKLNVHPPRFDRQIAPAAPAPGQRTHPADRRARRFQYAGLGTAAETARDRAVAGAAETVEEAAAEAAEEVKETAEEVKEEVKEAADAVPAGYEPLEIKEPKPMFVGTPQDTHGTTGQFSTAKPFIAFL